MKSLWKTDFSPLITNSIGCVQTALNQEPQRPEIPSVVHPAGRHTRHWALWLWCSHDSLTTIPKSSLGLVLFLESRLGRFLEAKGGSKQEWTLVSALNLHSEFKALKGLLRAAHTRTRTHRLLETLVRQIFLDFGILALGYCRFSCLFWIHAHTY